MTWAKIDDAAPHHPKFIAAGWEAFGLWVAGLCYCNRWLTDGLVPKVAVPGLLPGLSPKKAHELAVRLTTNSVRPGGNPSWIDEGDHYRVHDFESYQPTKAEVEAARAAARNRQRRHRSGRSHGVTESVTDGVANPVTVGEVPEASPQELGGTSNEVREAYSTRHGPPARPDPSRPVPDSHPHAQGARADEHSLREAADAIVAAYPAGALGGLSEAERAVFEAFRRGDLHLDGTPALSSRSLSTSACIERIRLYLASDRWREDGGRYVPKLANFLERGMQRTIPPPPGQYRRRSPHEAELEALNAAFEADRQRARERFARLERLLEAWAAVLPPELPDLDGWKEELRTVQLDEESVSELEGRLWEALASLMPEEDLAARSQAVFKGRTPSTEDRKHTENAIRRAWVRKRWPLLPSYSEASDH